MNHPFTHSLTHPPISLSQAGHLVAMAVRLANRAVMDDIRTETARVDLGDGLPWRDVRPMLDSREHSGPVLDMLGEALAYAMESGLVQRHPVRPYYIHIPQEVA